MLVRRIRLMRGGWGGCYPESSVGVSERERGGGGGGKGSGGGESVSEGDCDGARGEGGGEEGACEAGYESEEEVLGDPFLCSLEHVFRS